MAPVTSVPSRYYLRTHLHISFSPLQCIWELPVSHPTPSSNLTTLPLQPHLSKGTNPESFFWLGVTVHLVAEDYKVWRRRPCGMRRTRQEDEILCICYYHSAHCQCETFLLVNPQPLLMVFFSCRNLLDKKALIAVAPQAATCDPRGLQ